jgi:hypothetical protein
MAGTIFRDIYDLFMTLQEDYRLTALYNTSQTDFETYLEGWLVPSITEFDNCDQSLVYSSTTFTETLTQKNKNMLADLMKKRWLEKEIDDILQMNNFLQDRDFTRHSSAQNMEAKRKRYVEQKEEISQKLVNYSLNTTDWATWYSGVYYVP